MILIVVPEPTSITDSYALIKVMSQKHGRRSFKILLNLVRGEVEAGAIFNRIRDVSNVFSASNSTTSASSEGRGLPTVDSSAKASARDLPRLPGEPVHRGPRPHARHLPPAPGGGGSIPFIKRILEQRVSAEAKLRDNGPSCSCPLPALTRGVESRDRPMCPPATRHPSCRGGPTCPPANGQNVIPDDAGRSKRQYPMKIDGSTRICALIGNPVEHSLSPAIHNAAFAPPA